MIKLTILLILSAFFNLHAAVELTNPEIQVSQHLDRIIRDLRVTKVDQQLVKRTLKLINKTAPLFSSYTPWLKEILQTEKNLTKSNHRLCFNKISKPNKDILDRRLQNYCSKKILKYMNKNLSYSLKKYRSYLLKSTESFLFPFTNDFVSLLDKIKRKDKVFHKEISQRVLSLYQDKKLRVSTSLIKKLYIDSDLTSYVQKTGLLDPRENRMIKKIFFDHAVSFNEIIEDKAKSEKDAAKELHHLISFYKYHKKSISPDYAARVFTFTGKKFVASQYFAVARSSFLEALEITPKDQKADHLFNLLWGSIQAEDYKTALRDIKTYRLHDSFNTHSSQLKFWMAMIMERTTKKYLAEKYYLNIVKNNPISYYSVMSLKRLKELNPILYSQNYIKKVFLSSSTEPKSQLFSYQHQTIETFKRIHAFSQLNQSDLLKLERRVLLKKDLEKIFLITDLSKKPYLNDTLREQLALKLSSIFNLSENYLTSFSLIYNSINKNVIQDNSIIIENLFPRPYLNYLTEVAKRNNIDPIIILSLIRQESAFNPMARSHVGARGLMQLMPATARTIYRKISSTELYNPKTNLKIGTAYLKKLYKKYDGNLVHTLAAYNAGESRVRRWKKSYLNSDNIIYNIESIPFEETNKYVKLIFRNLFFYKLLDGHTNHSKDFSQIFDIALAGKSL